MNLLLNLALGTLMISLTVVIHTFGLIGVTRVMSWIIDRIRLHGHRSRILAMNTVVLGVFCVLTAEVWLWALCYRLIGFLGDFSTALYFSTVTFSTIGYGDVIPHPEWRMLAGLEGVSGFLLIGWSTAYLVAAGIRVGPFRSGEHF
ncbi:MAG: potassium channel family protein [Ferrovibrio sp.]|uniref:Potassium channel family protein n=1 Tax=Ciceribacter sichuanensis TaxID=2949647 RepID=A0AAJ1BVB1_9HYPH|nr:MULTISPECIES: potassium channel family protein [Alphaproteobacteria]MCM2398784.1 potassium channel family protein [Ciceribacter sp. S95]MCM2403617.1 potassium channel family protein [Ciceribacter sp. S153]MCO5957010.1 potassium channel family protein [Ciceribacter sp. S101]MCW0232806.1 potassium channel family protein [Ferrovibrio sp.]